MSTSEQPKQKPAAKRYPYDRNAQCHTADQVLEIKLLNISVSGIQFASTSQIDKEQPIKLQWMDPKFGEFVLPLVIKREVYKPENREFQYYYGSQYFSLDDSTKKSLVNLLKYCSLEEKNSVRLQVEKITPNYIFQVIDEGRGFLRQATQSSQAFPQFEKILDQIVDYEKEAFTSSDDVSIYIQKLTTHHFHCNLFCMLGPIVAEQAAWKVPYFARVATELQKISTTENEADEVVKKIMEQDDEESKKMQLRINESSNRLFYMKQNMLLLQRDTFQNSMENESPEIQKHFSQIQIECDRVLGVSNTPVASTHHQAIFERRVKESTVSKKIVDLLTGVSSDDSPKKSGGNTYIVLAVAILLLVGIVFVRIIGGGGDAGVKVDSSGMGLTLIKPIKSKKLNQQINLTIRKGDWQKLSEEQKAKVGHEIMAYIHREPSVSYVVLYDDNERDLEVYYRGMPLPALPAH